MKRTAKVREVLGGFCSALRAGLTGARRARMLTRVASATSVPQTTPWGIGKKAPSGKASPCADPSPAWARVMPDASDAQDMRHFRPNLVVRDCEPHTEDRWRRIRVGEIELRVVKPCSRCPIPGIVPDTGVRHGRVLETLMTYRRGDDNRIYFGQNLLHDIQGELAVGAPVEILA